VLERLDYTWERHRWYTGVNTEIRPRDLFRDHIFGCFIENVGIPGPPPDRGGQPHVRGRLPHSDSNFPASRQKLAGVLAHVAEGEARQIAEENARRVFNFPRQ